MIGLGRLGATAPPWCRDVPWYVPTPGEWECRYGIEAFKTRFYAAMVANPFQAGWMASNSADAEDVLDCVCRPQPGKPPPRPAPGKRAPAPDKAPSGPKQGPGTPAPPKAPAPTAPSLGRYTQAALVAAVVIGLGALVMRSPAEGA